MAGTDIHQLVAQLQAKMEKTENELKHVKTRMEKTENENKEEIRGLYEELALKKDKIKKSQDTYDVRCNDFVKGLGEWKSRRQKSIDVLQRLSEYIEKQRNDTNIAELSGSTVGMVGTGLSVAGLIATPLTG